MLLEQKEGGFWSTGAPRLETFSKQSRTRRGAAQQELYIHRSSTRLPIGNISFTKMYTRQRWGGRAAAYDANFSCLSVDLSGNFFGGWKHEEGCAKSKVLCVGE